MLEKASQSHASTVWLHGVGHMSYTIRQGQAQTSSAVQWVSRSGDRRAGVRWSARSLVYVQSRAWQGGRGFRT